MPITGGFTGKTLRVDLTTRTVTVEPTLGTWSNGKAYGKFWGKGMAYKVLWDEVPASVRPYDPANRIIFGWGPLAGTGAPSGSGRTAITSLSPGHLKYAVVSGHMGGFFCSEAKYAGWDGIIVQGKAPGPVYIAIRDDDVQIVDCPKMWGTGIYNATASIIKEMGPSAQVAAIGQAGENMVAQSVVITGNSHSAGAGMGAVMGSKNLKAIGVIGTGSLNLSSDKRTWRALIDNVLALEGACNQAVVPSTLQPWSEYASSGRWGGGKNVFWQASTPPIETGVCDPHDRQSIGYRTYHHTTYLGASSNPWFVRNDGCHGCPVRCHAALNVPSAARWGSTPYAINICGGFWGRGLMDASKYPAAEATVRNVEAAVVGVHMTDDLGLWNNYGLTEREWPFLYGADKGLTWIKPNVPTAEWNELNAAGGLLDLYEKGDLGFINEFGRRMAFKIGVLGKALAGPVDTFIESWHDKDGNPMGPVYRSNEALLYWQWGFPKHHSNESGGQIGALLTTGYNRDPQNHTHTKILSGGLPSAVSKPIFERQFAINGYGAGMSAAIPASNTNLSRMNVAKAKVAKFSILRKELHDSLGMCNWMYPFIYSPLKERGYEGDLTLEAQLYSAATGDTKTMLALDTEAERFYTLQRALTIRSFNSVDMRTLHDQLPVWAMAGPGSIHPAITPFTPGSNYLEQADWDLALDMFYAEWGYDQATGAPTRATLTALGMPEIADALQAQFPGSIWG